MAGRLGGRPVGVAGGYFEGLSVVDDVDVELVKAGSGGTGVEAQGVGVGDLVGEEKELLLKGVLVGKREVLAAA